MKELRINNYKSYAEKNGWKILMCERKKYHWTTTKLIVFGYLAVIAAGTLLLMLPVSNRQQEVTPFIDAWFTATSATCVTGLVLHDTYTFWTSFGQCVILVLIQIGGIGFMTIAISALTFTKRKIGLSKRLLMQESMAAPQVGGIVKMAKFVFSRVVLFEGIGAILLGFYFVPRLGAGKGIFFSLFHSVSAFCNAGIDLMGYFEPGSSLMTASGSVLVSVTVMLLIITGGLGFWVWADVRDHKWHFRNYRLHTKVVFASTGILIFGGALLMFLFEFGRPSMEGRSLGEQILCAFFQAVTPRTAGFNTMDLTGLTGCGKALIVGLMFIGGSPGSTAGGIKTTTVSIMLLSIWSEFRKRKDIECFRRRMEEGALRHACCVTMLYGFLALSGAVLIASVDRISINVSLFEAVSAIGTVGLSLGATAGLSAVSHIVLILLMFVGRVGGITILIAFGNRIMGVPSKLPMEKVPVG